MDKTIIESSAVACFNIRCCALGTIIHICTMALGERYPTEQLRHLTSLARSAWLSLLETLEQNIQEETAQKLLYHAAYESITDILDSLENFLVAADKLPWSCQSIEYMRLASATYAPLTFQGSLFEAYNNYYHTLRDKLSPWIGHKDLPTAVNSIVVIARHTADALERRIQEPSLQFQIPHSAILSPDDMPKIALPVPQCPACGQLMSADSEGTWYCDSCYNKQEL